MKSYKIINNINGGKNTWDLNFNIIKNGNDNIEASYNGKYNTDIIKKKTGIWTNIENLNETINGKTYKIIKANFNNDDKLKKIKWISEKGWIDNNNSKDYKYHYEDNSDDINEPFIEFDDTIYDFIGGGDNEIQNKLNNCYNEIGWTSGSNDLNNIFFYIKNKNDTIISVVRINKLKKNFDFEMTRENYKNKGLINKLIKYRFDYYLKTFINEPYNLYTQDNYIKKEHLDIGMFLANKEKINLDNINYWHLKTIMEDVDLEKRLIQDKIIDAIFIIDYCMVTQIKNDTINNNNYFLSALHCSIKKNNDFNDRISSINMKNQIGIIKQFYAKKNCNIDKDDENKVILLINENIDISIYSGNKTKGSFVSSIIWNQETYNFFDEIKNLKYIFYNKNKKIYYLDSTKVSITNKHINNTTSNCYTIKVIIDVSPGDSGGSLFVYIKEKFYIIATLIGVDNKFPSFSPLCNINKTMYPEFYTKFSGTIDFIFNDSDKVDDFQKNEIISNFLIVEKLDDFK